MYIKCNEHEWVVLMSRKSVDHIFPTNILTITEEKTKTVCSENAIHIFA
jgi:hypothetical protein